MVGGVVAMSGLIACPEQIWLVVEPMDLRRGIDGLSLWVQETLGDAPGAGSAFIFHNRSRSRLKVLLWDGNGVWLCQRRLHRGRFVLPRSQAPRLSMSQAEWSGLIAGIDWQRLSALPPAHLRV